MKNEIAAGGLVIRKQKRGWYLLMITDMNGSRTFPKGKVEAGENFLQAAKREIAEETGVNQLEMIREFRPVHYQFHRNGLVDKTVHYFLFQTGFRGKLLPQHEEGIKKAGWVSLNNALIIVGYPETNRPLLGQLIKSTKLYSI
jgi:8-oxo-dGTP pyrophosphatase MutT (NUDIX family)